MQHQATWEGEDEEEEEELAAPPVAVEPPDGSSHRRRHAPTSRRSRCASRCRRAPRWLLLLPSPHPPDDRLPSQLCAHLPLPSPPHTAAGAAATTREPRRRRLGGGEDVDLEGRRRGGCRDLEERKWIWIWRGRSRDIFIRGGWIRVWLYRRAVIFLCANFFKSASGNQFSPVVA